MDISLTDPEDLVQIVIEYISHVSFSHGHIISMLIMLQYSLRNNDIEEIRNFFRELLLDVQELKVFFTVPKLQILSNLTPTLNSNEVVAVFINFLLLMVEVILRFEEDSIARVKGSFQNLRTELGFLVSFLGDTAMHLQPTKTILMDIEDVVNEVGSFLYSFLLAIVVFILISKVKGAYTRLLDLEVVVNEVRSLFHSDLIHLPLRSTNVKAREKKEKKAMMDIKALLLEIRSLLDFFIFTKNDQVMETGILDLALSDLLAKFETLKTKIKEHCITVSKMPSDMTPKIGVVSLFIIDSVLDDLMDQINNNSDSIVPVTDQIVTLHKELMLLGSSITDIALQPEAEHEELVIRSRDIAYEVEYVINTCPHIWYLTLRLPQLIEKTQLIMMAVKEMKNNIDVARMSNVSKYPHEHVESQSKEPPILEDIVVGFDNVAIEIAEQLTGGTHQLQIISIFGMPGLGKTTLANKLYNHPFVLHHFDKRAWCVVSKIYNKKNVLIGILSSMSNSKRDTYMKKGEERLAEDLYRNLKGRRYLIVIDDIWDVNVLIDLKRYFPDDRIGSRILFTTRNKEVGLKASPRSVINELPFLSEVECWEILQEKVFQDKKCPQELLEIGKLIAKNCHGLPLAVVVIAGVLANVEKKKDLWAKIARNLSSHISEIPGKYFQILQFSYNHLPMHLKPCFLYFGAFEEDMEIPVRRLISLWAAEGFIKKEEQKSIEDVALEYLMKLIDRSLVLVAERRIDGEVKTCKIHDLLHEMCLGILKEDNFLKFIGHGDDVEQWSNVSKHPQEHVESQSKEPPILEDIVVGFDNVASEIKDQLIREKDQLQIISIFGMPGLGKTTLANKLYNDPSVLHHFDKRAWCVVSQIYNKKNVLIEILSSMGNSKRDTYMKKEEESLVEDLYKNLKRMRYLIVIDDIWDINVWIDLKRCFPDDRIGSRILFTTRNKEVGLRNSPRSVLYELPFLPEVECWEILQKKVFQDKICPQELQAIGKLIAKNCHGVPLTVVVIAGVLANVEKKKHLWEKIARNLSSHISEIPGGCIQILQLSYNHLPMHLKPCFLYFGAFKEDRGIPVRELISLWVAEGFIKKEEQKNIEDVALEYLMKLIDRSLVIVAERSFDGEVKTCKIHDLLREMCLRIAEDNNFLKFIGHGDDVEQWLFNQLSTYQKHHHLSINCAKSPSSLPFGLRVRSFRCNSDSVSFDSFITCSCKVLRVFSGRYDRLIGFEHLVHLRYLATSYTLPPMESFHKLEFLVVHNSDEVEIPEILLNMALRHMEFKGGAHFSESSRQLATKSKSFQINILQSISVLSIYTEMDENILRSSPNLRRLKVKLGRNSLNCSIGFLNQLETLTLFSQFRGSCSLISLPLNLKKLRLDSAEVSRKQMEIIGRLPNLQVLKLVGVVFEGKKWDTSEGEFPQLKHLMLNVVKIVEWNASADNFPRLQRIVLEFCKNLKMIPSSFGDIPTLQKIQLYSCGQTANELAKKIEEEQKELGNEWLEVTISGTYGDIFSEESDSE